MKRIAQDSRTKKAAKAARPFVIGWLGKKAKKVPDLYRKASPIVAVTGPAGAGKTVLVNQLCSKDRDYTPLLSAFTDFGSGDDHVTPAQAATSI